MPEHPGKGSHMLLMPLTRRLIVSVPDSFNINIWFMHNAWFVELGVYECKHCKRRDELGAIWKHVSKRHPQPHRDMRTNVFYRAGRIVHIA
jgi:hypothetical protein